MDCIVRRMGSKQHIWKTLTTKSSTLAARRQTRSLRHLNNQSLGLRRSMPRRAARINGDRSETIITGPRHAFDDRLDKVLESV